jgi:hypothetical protein
VFVIYQSFLSFFHPFHLVGHFLFYFFAQLLFFKVYVKDESLKDKKTTKNLSFLLHIFVNFEQKLTKEMSIFAFESFFLLLLYSYGL